LSQLCGPNEEVSPVSPVQAGEVVDDLTFTRPDGTAVRLSELATGPALLVFLRHLA
jgi:hypothetical protein